jgi:TPR repeat protein
MTLRILCVFFAATVAMTYGPVFSASAPATDCDTYAASDLDPQRKASGVPFDKINSVLAIPACESAVRKYPNSVRLIYQLGRAYAQKKDFRSAFVQYLKAAGQGYVLAEYNLGVLYERGWGVAKDEAEAVACYRRAAEQGFGLAQSNLGNMYRNGQGVPQDYAESLMWLHKAADQGDAHALAVLGVMYSGGQGVPQDYTEAVKFYRKAAERGDAQAQTSLGSTYGLGQGVPQDYTEAAKWFRLAADQGFANAQYLLGLLYEHGDGVPKILAEAADWYRKAAAQGNDEARKKLVSLDADAKTGRTAEEAGNAVLHKAPLVDPANIDPQQADTGHSESESLTRVKRCQALNRSVPRSGPASYAVPQWTPEKTKQYNELGCWQRVEADNGAAFQIDLGLIQDFPPGATAPVYSAEGGQFNPMNLKRWYFDCRGHIRVQQDVGLTPWTYVPPRSVAAQIGNIVCAGAGIASPSGIAQSLRKVDAQDISASGAASESASGVSAFEWYTNRAKDLGRASAPTNIAIIDRSLGSDSVDVNDPGWIKIESKGEVSATIDTRSVQHDTDGNAHASTCIVLHNACLKVFKQRWFYNCQDHTYSWLDTSILPGLPRNMHYAEPTSVADKLLIFACR